MLRLIVALFVAAALAACTPPEPAFHGTDITGAEYGRDFALTDHLGQRRQLADYRGKVVTLFFGYTQCPDVCPTTLSTMNEVMKRLGTQAARVQVLFITVDPERDTQQLLSEYVPAFNPSFVGLRGDAAQTEAVKKEFKVLAQKQGDLAGGHYTVDHTAATYIIDPAGRLRLYIRHGETPLRIAADLERLLAEPLR